jgi:hypothetical protein
MSYVLVPSYSMDSHAVPYDQPSQHIQQITIIDTITIIK